MYWLANSIQVIPQLVRVPSNFSVVLLRNYLTGLILDRLHLDKTFLNLVKSLYLRRHKDLKTRTTKPIKSVDRLLIDEE